MKVRGNDSIVSLLKYYFMKIKSFLQQSINRILGYFGLHLKKSDSGMWDYDLVFSKIYKKIKDRTLVKIDRSYMLYQFAQMAASFLEGDVAQVGVYRGGTARMISECFIQTNKTIFLFDTFEGLPDKSEFDTSDAGDDILKEFNDVNFSDVENYFKDIKNISFRKGFFPETTKGLEQRKFCFVYLDADLYQSTKDGLQFFYERMIPGGVIILDDYKSGRWPGVERAVQEFCISENIVPVQTTWWQGVIIKH